MRPRHLAMALGSLFLGLPLLAAPGVVTSLATATSAAAASSATPSISATRLDDGRVRLSGRTRAGRSDLNVQRYDDSRRRYIHVRRSEEHTSELQSLMRISYAVFCVKQT